jgi:hypothetical protein
MKFYFLFLLLFGISFCAIYTNSPKLDGQLQILIEGAQNSSISVISPSGARHEIILQNSQAQYFVDESGEWIVEYRSERAKVIVPPLESTSIPENKSENSSLFFGIAPSPGLMAAFFATIAIFAIVAFAAAGAAALSHPSFAKKCACLSKKRANGFVKVLFIAGSTPASDVRVIDSVGDEWAGEKMNMRSKKLEGLQKLALEYQYFGKIGQTDASWIEDGKIKSLRLFGEGEICGKEDDACVENSAKANKLKKCETSSSKNPGASGSDLCQPIPPENISNENKNCDEQFPKNKKRLAKA